MEKKKRRFNAVDVIFLIVIVLGVLFIALRLGGIDVVEKLTGGDKTETFIVTFSGDEVPEFVAERIENGAPVKDEELSVSLGTVSGLVTGPSRSVSNLPDGTIVVSSRDGYLSVELSATLNAKDTGNGIEVDGLLLGVGHSMTLRAGDAKMYLIVSDIRRP